MRRCEDVNMFGRPPLLEEPFAQTLSGKNMESTPNLYGKKFTALEDLNSQTPEVGKTARDDHSFFELCQAAFWSTCSQLPLVFQFSETCWGFCCQGRQRIRPSFTREESERIATCYLVFQFFPMLSSQNQSSLNQSDIFRFRCKLRQSMEVSNSWGSTSLGFSPALSESRA